MIHRNLNFPNGEVMVYRMLLFYMCFAPAGLCYSLDRLISERRGDTAKEEKNDSLPLVWPVRLMQLNFLFIYVHSLPVKLIDGVEWQNGQMFYFVVANDIWSRDWLPLIFHQYDCLLSKIMTYGTLVIEAGIPILIWFRKTRLIAIAAGVFLHVAIAIIIANATFFTLSMIAGYCLFLPPDLVRQWLSFEKQPEVELSQESTG